MYMLVGPIRNQFGVSDLQIGYLIGPAFIVSFMLVGLPAGLAVDRLDRRKLVIAAGILWSIGTTIGTTAAALATRFETLVLTRVLVGGAEAVLFPAGMSLIADLFHKRHLPIAYSAFLAAPYLGGGMALIVGGVVLAKTEAVPSVTLPVLGSIVGWQSTFLIVGLAGLAPVLLMFTVREAARPSDANNNSISLADGLRFMLVRWRFYAFFFPGMSISGLVMAMVAAWAPTYLQRTFSMPPADIGLTYGIYVLAAGLAGGIAGPVVNIWIARRFPRSTMWTACIGPVLILTFILLFSMVHTRDAALVCLALFTFSYSFPLSVAGTSLQVVTPPKLRGLAAGIYLVSNSLLGYALGPTLVPLAARYLFGGEMHLGEAIKLVGLVCGLVSLSGLVMAAIGFRRHAG
jgi:MFS family permease